MSYFPCNGRDCAPRSWTEGSVERAQNKTWLCYNDGQVARSMDYRSFYQINQIYFDMEGALNSHVISFGRNIIIRAGLSESALRVCCRNSSFERGISAIMASLKAPGYKAHGSFKQKTIYSNSSLGALSDHFTRSRATAVTVCMGQSLNVSTCHVCIAVLGAHSTAFNSSFYCR